MAGRGGRQLLESLPTQRLAGLHRGKVIDSAAPKDAPGTVQVEVVSLTVGPIAARVLTPFAEKEAGLQWWPSKDEEVLVMFARGRGTEAIVIGSLWSGAHPPPRAADRVAKELVLRTPRGHELRLDDEAGTLLVMHANRKSWIAVEKDRVRIQSGGDLTITAQGTLGVQATSAVVAAASDALTVQASQLTVASAVQTDLAGGLALQGALALSPVPGPPVVPKPLQGKPGSKLPTE